MTGWPTADQQVINRHILTTRREAPSRRFLPGRLPRMISRLGLEMYRVIVVPFCGTSSVSAYRAAVPGIRVYPGARPGWGPGPGAGSEPDTGAIMSGTVIRADG